MTHDYYERKLNDVIIKCPIESGIEIIVFNLLDAIIDSSKYAVVDINSLRKDRDMRLETSSGIADIAIVSQDFVYQKECGRVYSFVEVKVPHNPLKETAQIKGQKKDISHYIYTNGIEWKYYFCGEEIWRSKLADYSQAKNKICDRMERVFVNLDEYNKLLENIKSIEWEKT